jgi:hypothetical protein
MSDDELAQVQKDIGEQLERIRIDWLRLATADFDPEERKRIRDGIMSNEDQLMVLLERKWALRRN